MSNRETVIDEFLHRHGIKFSYEFTETGPHNLWRVKFKCGGKQWTLTFKSPHAPTAYDVLYCVVADNFIHENDEYEDVGYDPIEEPEEYKRITTACAKQYKRYHEFFGSLTETLDTVEELGCGDDEREAVAAAKFAAAE